MNEPRPDPTGKVLNFAAVVEVATGLLLIIDPAIVARLLLGVALTDVAAVLARCFGIALVALGLACWRAAGKGAFRGMLLYNALIAAYLAYLGSLGHLRGVLLWPAVALHAGVALLLAWPRKALG